MLKHGKNCDSIRKIGAEKYKNAEVHQKGEIKGQYNQHQEEKSSS